MPRDSATIVAIENSEHSVTVRFSDGSSASYAVDELKEIKPTHPSVSPRDIQADSVSGAPPPLSDRGSLPDTSGRVTVIAAPEFSPASSLLIGDGEMAELIRVHPWSESPLGAMEHWPASLVTHVNLILNSPQALAIYWGPEMIFIGNDESVRLIGPRLVEALGLPARDLWGEHWDQMEGRLMSVFFTGKAVSGASESFLFSRPGKPDEAFIDYSLTPIYDDGKVAGVFRELHEKTDTVNAMRALAESNDRLKMALQGGTGFGVWDYHIQTGIVYCDETIARLYDLDAAAAARGVSHMQLQRMLHPEDIVILSDGIMQSILTGKDFSVEYRVRRLDGSYGWVQSMGRCLFDDEGHAYRVTGLKTDVTERRLREADSARKVPMALFSGGQWDALPGPIRSFLEATFYFLTEHPEDITLEVLAEGDESRIIVHAGEENLGKLIGKQGRTIRSVRTLLMAVGASGDRRFTIEVESGKKALAAPDVDRV